MGDADAMHDNGEVREGEPGELEQFRPTGGEGAEHSSVSDGVVRGGRGVHLSRRQGNHSIKEVNAVGYEFAGND